MVAERVYTVEEYFDGPVSGVADFAGRPHLYKRIFDEVEDEYSSQFDLTPIDPALLAIILEKWAIWQRWEICFARKKVPLDSHPGYGGRDPEYDRLHKTIEGLKGRVSAPAIRATGDFRALATPDP